MGYSEENSRTITLKLRPGFHVRWRSERTGYLGDKPLPHTGGSGIGGVPPHSGGRDVSACSTSSRLAARPYGSSCISQPSRRLRRALVGLLVKMPLRRSSGRGTSRAALRRPVNRMRRAATGADPPVSCKRGSSSAANASRQVNRSMSSWTFRNRSDKPMDVPRSRMFARYLRIVDPEGRAIGPIEDVRDDWEEKVFTEGLPPGEEATPLTLRTTDNFRLTRPGSYRVEWLGAGPPEVDKGTPIPPAPAVTFAVDPVASSPPAPEP